MTVPYIIANVVIAVGYLALDMFLDSKLDGHYEKPEKAPAAKSFAMISGDIEGAGILLMFLCRSFAYFNVCVLAILLVVMIADKIKKIAERKAKSADNTAEAAVGNSDSHSQSN